MQDVKKMVVLCNNLILQYADKPTQLPNAENLTSDKQQIFWIQSTMDYVKVRKPVDNSKEKDALNDVYRFFMGATRDLPKECHKTDEEENAFYAKLKELYLPTREKYKGTQFQEFVTCLLVAAQDEAWNVFNSRCKEEEVFC